MPEGKVLEGEVLAGTKEGAEQGENGTKQHVRLPDDAPERGPAENQEVCVSVVIISAWPEADGFFELHRVTQHRVASLSRPSHGGRGNCDGISEIGA